MGKGCRALPLNILIYKIKVTKKDKKKEGKIPRMICRPAEVLVFSNPMEVLKVKYGEDKMQTIVERGLSCTSRQD